MKLLWLLIALIIALLLLGHPVFKCFSVRYNICMVIFRPIAIEDQGNLKHKVALWVSRSTVEYPQLHK